MNKVLKRVLSLVLVCAMLVSAMMMLASCGGGNEPEQTYTYNDAVTLLSTNWNPHTYQTTDESYPIDFITTGLYTFIFRWEYSSY